MAKEIPILFSTAMVQAILAGRKTQTRRVVKPQPIDNTEVDGNFFEGNHKGYVKVDGHPNWKEQFAYEFCPYGKAGDILWVRETVSARVIWGRFAYKASVTDKDDLENTRWRPSIHMPKAAARIWLKVKSIRVERLQDISEEDAKAEGLEVVGTHQDGTPLYKRYKDHDYGDGLIMTAPFSAPQASFCNLWKSINGPDSWTENPWVWVVEYEVLTTTGKPEGL